MTVIERVHEDHGATFGSVGGRRVAMDYGRPDRATLAVRNGAGVVEAPYGVVAVEGEDRAGAVDRVLEADVPREEGLGTYSLAMAADGRVGADAYAYHAGDRMLCFVPPDRSGWLADAVAGRDATARDATDEFAVFGIHGPMATEKVAGVLHGAGAPDDRLSFVRGRMDAGVTVIRTDAPAGEESYEVVCDADDADTVVDVLLNYGPSAPPFGYRTWETLTLEAGTPLYDPDLVGRKRGVLGPDPDGDRLVGLALDAVPDSGAPVLVDGLRVGTVTRAVESPVLEEAIGFAVVEDDFGDATARVGKEAARARRRDPPFVEGSERSGRLVTRP